MNESTHEFESTAAESFPRRQPMSGTPQGLLRPDAEGLQLLDAMAGRVCPFGFGCQPIADALREAAGNYLGDAAALADMSEGSDDALLGKFRQWLGESDSVSADSMVLTSSADLAVEEVIRFARRSGGDSAYRILTMVGSDHGRTGVCRTASGRPELHDGYGPMMAGFAHVPSGDLDALRAAVDDVTAAVLLSPLEGSRDGKPIDQDDLIAIRELCDQLGLMLIIDQSRIGVATSSQPLVHESIADVTADAVILSAGLFAGLPGGIMIASNRLTGDTVIDCERFPLLSTVAHASLDQMLAAGLPASADERCHALAVEIAESLQGFEFVRDLHVLGTNFAIELDFLAAEFVSLASAHGLLVESAGESAIRMQLPAVISDQDRQSLLHSLRHCMEAAERHSAGLPT